MEFSTIFRRAYWILVTLGAVYVLGILALTFPIVQRNALYAHNVNPALWQNLSNVEQFGFLKHQVQPFTVATDNATLYAWHILPIQLYREHQEALESEEEIVPKPYLEASTGVGFQLLLSNPDAIVVVSFHGNAAHLASSYRPATYQQFLGLSTPEKPVHVVAFDYRGFGLSTGTPTEQGVIDDALALLSTITGYDTSVLNTNSGSPLKAARSGVDPSRIILVGQSMGTFVSTALFHEWAVVRQLPAFRTLVLLASFTSLPRLLDCYSIKGLAPPMLSPLMTFPQAQRWVMSKIVDSWDTARRLKELVETPGIGLDLAIMHAGDDWEIPWREGYGNWKVVAKATNGTGVMTDNFDSLDRSAIASWTSDDKRKKVRWEKVAHGGHNRIPTSEQTRLVILNSIEKD